MNKKKKPALALFTALTIGISLVSCVKEVNGLTGDNASGNLNKHTQSFNYGDFHNELLGNVVNVFDETIEFDSVEQVVEYVYGINEEYINGMELDEETRALCLSFAEIYKNLISYYDFKYFVLDNPEYEFSLQNCIRILYNTQVVSESDYLNLIDFSERVLDIYAGKYNSKDIPDSIVPMITKSRDMAETEVAYAIFDIARGSFDFWRDHEGDGNNVMAPHVAVVDACGAALGAGVAAMGQYATTGSVSNGWAVAIAAGSGAVTASTGLVTKTAAVVEKAAVKAGKYLGKIISKL